MDSLSLERPPARPGRMRRLVVLALTNPVTRIAVNNPVTRIILGFGAVIAVAMLIQYLLSPLKPDKEGEKTALVVVLHGLGAVVISSAMLGAYAVFVRLYEKRWPAEIGPRGFFSWNATGLGLGVVIMAAASSALWLGGWLVVEGTEPSHRWAALVCMALASNLIVACMEELLLRGIFFRIVEEVMGSWFALAASAILFGVLHVGNPNATWETALGLSLQAGVLLAGAYMVSRSLWLPIAIHCAWNAMQQGVIGGALSGNKVDAILTISPAGPERFSGGAFGIEGSVITTAICGFVGIIFCVIAVRRQKTIRGRWLTPRVRTDG